MDNFFDFSHLSFDDVLPKMHQNTDVLTKNDKECLDSLPLAMSYVPIQKFKSLYEPEVALCRGTLFAELDKPFLGCKKNWGAM